MRGAREASIAIDRKANYGDQVLERVTNVLPTKARTRADAHIRVINGVAAGTTASIPAAGAVIGASELADITIEDDAVSARHVSVRPGMDGFAVKDLESKNGTWLDGVRINSAKVPLGSVLHLGDVAIELVPSVNFSDIEPSTATQFGDLHGESFAMRRVFALLERAAPSDVPVLILGESGTGKELAARALHEQGPRAEGPFVVVDCGAASPTLLRAQLFGHEKGAFTGAGEAREGAFRAANGGTLFLDEIGDLPLDLQPALLRMLESKEVIPLGGHAPKSSDVRVVAATHRDLAKLKSAGMFRGDLYYRLAVVELQMPALRRRSEDIPLLASKFLKDEGIVVDNDKAGPQWARLAGYGWPGNVRELRNTLSRSTALAAANTPFSQMEIHFPSESAIAEHSFVGKTFHEVKAELLAELESSYLRYVVSVTDSMTAAAKLAGVERKYLYKLLDKYNLR